MANNGQLGSHLYRPKELSKSEKAFKKVSSGMKKSYSLLAKSGKAVKQGGYAVGSTIKQTSDTIGVTSALSYAQKNATTYGSKAIESAKDGSLRQKTTNTIYAAGSVIGSFGSTIYRGLTGTSPSRINNQNNENEVAL